MKRSLILFCVLLLSVPVHAATKRDLLVKGGKAYGREKYGMALDLYKKASAKDAVAPEPVYNSAAAIYKLKDYSTSAKIYEDMAKQDWKYKQASYFNAGNAQFRAAQKDKAKEDYRRAILLDPQDKAAIHNLQVLLQDNQQDQSDNKKQDQNQDKDNQQGQDKQENKDNSMSRAEAQRLLQMASEQEQKDRSRSQQKYGEAGEDVEKDW